MCTHMPLYCVGSFQQPRAFETAPAHAGGQPGAATEPLPQPLERDHAGRLDCLAELGRVRIAEVHAPATGREGEPRREPGHGPARQRPVREVHVGPSLASRPGAGRAELARGSNVEAHATTLSCRSATGGPSAIMEVPC